MSVKARLTRIENLVADMNLRLKQLERGFKGPLIVPSDVLHDEAALADHIQQYQARFLGPVSIILPAVDTFDWQDDASV